MKNCVPNVGMKKCELVDNYLWKNFPKKDVSKCQQQIIYFTLHTCEYQGQANGTFSGLPWYFK